MNALLSRSLWSVAVAACTFSSAVHAVDGVVLIDQNKAVSGNLTPGDAPGFPVVISQPGSYRLSGNLTVPDADTTAIEVRSGNVTIDLNGFAILGPTRCGFTHECDPVGAGIGISAAGANNLTVINGTIRGMGSSAILPIITGPGGASLTNRFERLQLESNGGPGIGRTLQLGEIANGNIHVRGSTISNNGGDGILARGRCIIADNIITDNGGDGVRAGGCNITGNTFTFNAGFGLNGDGNGYANNVFTFNNAGMVQVNGTSVQLGANLCTGVLCP